LSLLLAAASVLAAEQRIATILIHGLRHIDRERLLDDLLLSEGGAYTNGLERRVERRARRLPYVRTLRVESRAGVRGMHLTLRVREASRLNLHPFFTVQEDGELGGGFHLESYTLLGLGERWLGTVMGGSRTEAHLAIREMNLGPAWLPDLAFDLGFYDWDDPFWKSDVRRYWALAGPSFRLPGGGSVLVLGGFERISSNPPRGLDPGGEDDYALFRGIFRQPLRQDALELSLVTELWTREQERGFARGVLSLAGRRHQGRWDLEALAAAGLSTASSPTQGLQHLDSWRYLRAYELGSLPARDFHFLRLRADFRLIGMPVRLRRGAPESQLVYGLFVLAEGARLRLTRTDAYDAPFETGLGLSVSLPTRIASRASFGVIWDRDGNPKNIVLLEER